MFTLNERTLINTYLFEFNDANKLLKLDSSGEIPTSLIPGGLDYLPTDDPTFTGKLTGPYIHINSDDADAGIWDSDFGQNNGINFNGTNTINLITDGSEKITLTGQTIEFNGNRLQDIGTPTTSTDAATKAYVDGLVAEGVKPVDSVKAATTGNITLSGVQSIDGYSLSLLDRVLVKDQTIESDNGIYEVSDSGWNRIAADSLQGTLVFVENGITHNDSKWYCEDTNSWIKFSQVDEINAGSGLTKTGTTLSIENGDITNAMLEGSINWSKMANSGSISYKGSWTNTSNEFDAIDGGNLKEFMNATMSAIKLLRGTTTYAFDNSETIAGAYDRADTKNRSYTSEPASPTSGDMWFDEIV
jgi:hypothetical protein